MSYIGRQNLGGAYRQLDDISSGFDGSDTTHTMQVNSQNVTVGDVNQIILSLGGVIQKPGTDFTVSGSVLTFTTAPASGLSFFAILLGSDNGGTVTPTDGSVTGDKLASNIAITTSGDVSFDGGSFVFNESGADKDFRIESDNNTHALFVQGSNGVVGFGTSTLNTNFNVAGGAEFTTTGNVNNFRIISTDDGSATAPDIVFVRDSASPADGDFLGRVDFRGDDSAGNETNFISLFARANVVTNGSEQGALTFTDGDGGNSLLHIQNTAVIFNQDSIDTDFRVESNGNTHMLFIDGGEDHVGINTSSNYHASLSTVASGERALFVYQNANQDTTAMQIRNAFAQSSNTASMIVFQDSGGTERGSIKTSGSATQFNTSSDYRLKENVDYDWDATTRLKQLKPARFNWIADDTNTLLDGFIAHEVSSVVPEAVAGEKDGMENYIDEDTGEEKTRIRPQGIDQSKLVPLMVKTIQELEARIKTLEDA